MADTCEFEGCPEPAEGWVEAQWSLFDFVRYDMCNDHLWEVYEDLAERRVDGQLVFEVGVRYYEPIIDWMA